jgi:threonine dehydratase
LRAYGVEVLTVEDADTLAAMRLLWQRLKLLVEPSSAIVLAALLKHRERFEGQRVGLLLSGGNVDLDALLPA